MNSRINDPVKDILALEEALINMDKKLEEAMKYIQSDEFIQKVSSKVRGEYEKKT